MANGGYCNTSIQVNITANLLVAKKLYVGLFRNFISPHGGNKGQKIYNHEGDLLLGNVPHLAVTREVTLTVKKICPCVRA